MCTKRGFSYKRNTRLKRGIELCSKFRKFYSEIRVVRVDIIQTYWIWKYKQTKSRTNILGFVRGISFRARHTIDTDVDLLRVGNNVVFDRFERRDGEIYTDFSHARITCHTYPSQNFRTPDSIRIHYDRGDSGLQTVHAVGWTMVVSSNYFRGGRLHIKIKL